MYESLLYIGCVEDIRIQISAARVCLDLDVGEFMRVASATAPLMLGGIRLCGAERDLPWTAGIHWVNGGIHGIRHPRTHVVGASIEKIFPQSICSLETFGDIWRPKFGRGAGSEPFLGRLILGQVLRTK